MGFIVFRGVTLEEFLYRCVVDGKAGLSFFLLAALFGWWSIEKMTEKIKNVANRYSYIMVYVI